MKVCILTCSTGEGHNSAARALQEELARREVPCDIVDPVGQASKRAEGFVSGFYNGLIRRMPRAFGLIYRIGAAWERSRVTSPVYYANAACSRDMQATLASGPYTHVICTHLYGMELMTAMRRKQLTSVPVWGVLTDYTPIPFLAETDLDGYFVPHADVGKALAEKGVDPARIVPSGIPVSQRFAEAISQEDARAALGLDAGKKLLLIMSGGVGCENTLRLCDAFLAADRQDISACVLTGHNARMRELVLQRDAGLGRLLPVPFTRDVPLYMRAADVLISKPGGLSSTEAAASRVPFVCVHAIPGCETENARFFAKHGMALSASNDAEAVRSALALADDPAAAERMRLAQRALVDPYAARTIVRKVIGP